MDAISVRLQLPTYSAGASPSRFGFHSLQLSEFCGGSRQRSFSHPPLLLYRLCCTTTHQGQVRQLRPQQELLVEGH
jgi:hypothetical protein